MRLELDDNKEITRPIEQDEKPAEKFAGKKNMIFFILYMAGNLILANFLFLICCIPVFTIGASLAALNKTVYKIFEETDVIVAKTFFVAFGKNFGQATGAWILLGSIMGLVIFDIYYCITHEINVWMMAIMIVGILILWIIASVMAYVFMLIPRYENRFLVHLINAFFIAYSNIGWTLIIWIAWILGLGVFIAFFPSSVIYAGWVIVLCLFSLLVLVACPIYKHIFYKFEHHDQTKSDLY